MACSPPSGGTGGVPLRAGLTLGEILRASLPADGRAHRLPAHHWKVLNALRRCRTAALGGHQYRCAQCGGEPFVPHSCRNRHCPACQGVNSHEWLAKQQAVLLPVPYFHVVFTLPHALNQAALYNLLWAAARQTLLAFGQQKFGAAIGITAVLHTWSQTLNDHYHLHGIVTGGGLTADEMHWVPRHPKFLFPVAALAQVFRGKFCAGLHRLHTRGPLQFHGARQPLAATAAFPQLVRTATAKDWVVYSKRPFAGPEQVLQYLARYTHRVGISPRRLVAFEEAAGTVTFRDKDYADDGRAKTMTLTATEFVRRLRLHFLPERFVKIRHYGLLANRDRQSRVAVARQRLGAPPPAPVVTPPAPVIPCPHCGQNALVLVGVTHPRRRAGVPVRLDSS